ncbi:MAG: hypothetical protein QME72_16920 [Rhodococcus sp. (in: high G+C Gram-positive bacteria)]|nr:hypothetical protein [Rhodococcus sp. (in: high G+C Gram-positive bacteria)]MDI6629396.1 hypothetical protein [Rhodococcus sp. (in: high G+C Gram-positive bacteria)]
MTDTPIHDELQNFMKMSTRGGDRTVEPVAVSVPVEVPVHAPARHHRA